MTTTSRYPTETGSTTVSEQPQLRALVLEHWRSDAFVVFGEVMEERRISPHKVLLGDDELPDWREFDLILALGGPMSVYHEAEYPWLVDEKRLIREAVEAGVPYFGVCFGAQLLASALGAEVYRGPRPELGVNPVFLTEAAGRDPVFRGFPRDLEVFEWHRDAFDLPNGAERLARSPRYPNQAMRVGRVAYGIQCHFEKSASDIAKALETTPAFLEDLEERHGRGAVDAFLASYATAVPFLQETARQLLRRWIQVAASVGAVAHAEMRGSSGRDAELVAREAEQTRLTNLLTHAREGGSGALVVRGDAGVGKTALLEWATNRALGMRILRAAGQEGEAELPFTGLRQICSPLLDRSGRLPHAQAEAIAGALALDGASAPGDRYAVYVAFLGLLAAAAEEAPTLVVVDDAHWLDEGTAEALAFAMRHGVPAGTAVVIATEGGAFGGLGAAEMTLDRLDHVAMRRLLEARVEAGFDPAVVEGLLRIAAGNPLALLTFARNLTLAQEAGWEDATGLLHRRATAEEAFLHRIVRLPAETRSALLVAALAGDARLETLDRAGRELPVAMGALEAAESAELVAIGEQRVTFCHPLARTAVVYNAPLADRRAVHAALARALTDPRSADRTSWHLALAASGPDEEAAVALEGTARRALGHRAPGAASRAYELAARLSADPQIRARRLLGAAESAYRAGNVGAALDHLESARPRATGALLPAEIDHLRGRIAARFGSAEVAREILVAAAERCEDESPEQAAVMLADAVIPCLRCGRPSDACRLGRRAVELAEGADRATQTRANLMLGTALIFTGEFQQGRKLVSSAADMAQDLADPSGELRAYVARSLRLAGSHDRARAAFTAVVADARSEGSLGVLPYALARFADLELENGEWTGARALLEEAVRLARETAQGADEGLALGTLAWLDAAQGRDDECRAHVAAASELAARLGTGSQLDRAGLALGLLALGRRRPHDAIAHLEETVAQQEAQGWSDAAVTPHAAPMLIEAYALAGRSADAGRLLAEFEAEAGRADRPSARAVSWRCRALLETGEEAERSFRRALEYDGPDLSSFERARTQLRYAAHSRRMTNDELARRHATEALAAFEALGAEPWAQQARQELGELGPRDT